jgi:subfamily B ATP-binding cassette protein MsbA
MPELMRLLGSVRAYRWHLAGGLVMMLGVGFFEAVSALLIGPIFDRVLKPDAPDSTVALISIPWVDATIYLDQLLPDWIHNVWTVVAVFILAVTIGKALCEYAAAYLVNFVGYSVIMDLRNQLYEKILGQSISFYHRYSTGMLMSTVLSDIERIQLAVSQVLTDFLRQTFTLIGLLLVVILIDWRLATVSLSLIPFVIWRA